MPSTSYLARKNGRNVETLFATAGGVSNAGQAPVLDSNGRLTADMMPAGYAPDADTLTASEPIAAGAFVNVYDAGSGAFKVRNAVATGAGYEAHGYVLAQVANNGQATVYFDDNNTAITAATPGPVYLSATTPGGFVAAPGPTGAGILSQRLGIAVAPGVIHTSIEPATVLAQ
jgi:hypothetical protein